MRGRGRVGWVGCEGGREREEGGRERRERREGGGREGGREGGGREREGERSEREREMIQYLHPITGIPCFHQMAELVAGL